jgi:predicted nicotinamide N-methyase
MSHYPSSSPNNDIDDIPWKESRFHNNNAGEQEEDDENDDMFAMFADPDPYQVFDFQFGTTINIQLHGQKQENGQLLHSTGLTLWRASEILCHYLLDHTEWIRDRRVLEVRA